MRKSASNNNSATISSIKTPPIRPVKTIYKFIGHCIYCGGNESLTKEHVIPYFLGGNIVLGKASCDKCSEITKKFEERLSYTLFSAYRRKFNIQSRSKTHSSRIRMYNLDSGKEEAHYVVEELPGFIALPELEAPEIFHNTHPSDKIGKLTLNCYNISGKDIHSRMDKARVEFDVDIFDLLRLIAKIGHGLMIYRPELSEYTPLLNDVVRYGHYASYFVGGCPPLDEKAIPDRPDDPAQKALTLALITEAEIPGDTIHTYLVAQIQLTPILGPLTYAAVVGRRIKPGANVISNQTSIELPIIPNHERPYDPMIIHADVSIDKSIK